MKRVNTDTIVSMFEWNDVELSQLDSLKGNAERINLKDKKYRHSCYMFELTYALVIEPNKNISSSTGC